MRTWKDLLAAPGSDLGIATNTSLIPVSNEDVETSAAAQGSDLGIATNTSLISASVEDVETPAAPGSDLGIANTSPLVVPASVEDVETPAAPGSDLGGIAHTSPLVFPASVEDVEHLLLQVQTLVISLLILPSSVLLQATAVYHPPLLPQLILLLHMIICNCIIKSTTQSWTH
jgi:hypothetical protein